MKIFRFLFAAVLVFSAYSQEQVKYNGNGNYVYIERTDLRRYDNGKYTGLTSREVKSYITQTRENSDRKYEGYFYVAEDTVHKMQSVGTVLNDAISSKFKITSSGELVMIEDNGYPTFRSFPTFPGQKIKKGDKWQAKAERTVDPLNSNVFTKMPIQVEYTYLRDEQYRGEEVFVFSAEWATRYGISYWDFGGDRNMKSAHGSHKATMYVSKKTGNALVVRDSVDETFEYNDGTKVAFKGTISLFTEYPPAFESGGAGLATTLDDYAKFATMLMNLGAYKGKQIMQEGTVRWFTGGDMESGPKEAFKNWDGLKGFSYANLLRVMKEPGKATILGVEGEYGWDGWLGPYFANDPKHKVTILHMLQRTDSGTTPYMRRIRNVVYSSVTE